MALPNTFAAVTAATGAQLDANFNADGKLGIIPCTVSGTNDLTLTPTAGIAPTIAAYSNYLQFSGIVVASNTGPVRIQSGSLPLLNAYKDSPAGPVALSGGELIATCAFLAEYDSALNTGAGGFHIWTNTGFAGGTITGNMVLSGATLSVLGGSIGASLSSSLLNGNSLTIAALYASLTSTSITGVGSYATLNASIASITSLQVGASAATMGHLVSGVGTLTFTVTPANTTQDQNIVIAGSQVRDVVALGVGSVPTGMGFTGFCGTIGTVTVRLLNPTASSISLSTFTIRASAMGLVP